jgi:hypothetical protein
MAEIQNALAAGKEVAVHQAPITQSGWTGSGYIITDPATGAGAYKISGGANGGVMIAKGLLTGLGIAMFFAGPAAIAAIAPFLLLLLMIVTIFVAAYSTLLNASDILDTGGKCAVQLADLYFWIFLPLSIIAGFIPSSAAAPKFVYTLIAIMYGSDLAKGVAASGACK